MWVIPYNKKQTNKKQYSGVLNTGLLEYNLKQRQRCPHSRQSEFNENNKSFQTITFLCLSILEAS
jgi:hypothetical protein